MASPSSPSPPPPPSTVASGDEDDVHHVYISFRGEEPGNNIAEMVDRSLVMRGVRSYRHQSPIARNHNGTAVEKDFKYAITTATISVVVLSKEYFASNLCLEELVLILTCRETKRLVVVPVFYDVDPSDIRKQRNDAGKGISKQTIGGLWWRRWSNALHVVGGLCGWDHLNADVRVESVLIGKIVEDIVHKRIPTNLITIHPLRYDTCDAYLSLFLQMGKNDVLIVGISGPSRMGKTVIAKSAFDQIFYSFDGSTFLTDVGQSSRQPNGLVILQEKLLRNILLDADIVIDNVIIGMNMIKEKLCDRRVLVVLDNVDNLEQLFALVGSRGWFGPGSKIIITTKNLHLLNKFGVDQVFTAQGSPLPSNIHAIWGQVQQSHRVIMGLKEYIERTSHMNNLYMKYLENRLVRERSKSSIQPLVTPVLEH